MTIVRKHLHLIYAGGVIVLLAITTWMQAARANRAEREAAEYHRLLTEYMRACADNPQPSTTDAERCLVRYFDGTAWKCARIEPLHSGTASTSDPSSPAVTGSGNTVIYGTRPATIDEKRRIGIK